MKYRIQVEELNNGERAYTPEVGYEQLIFWGLFRRTEWYNICKDARGRFDISTSARYIYKTIEEAVDIITKYKEWKVIEISKEVKLSSHINID